MAVAPTQHRLLSPEEIAVQAGQQVPYVRLPEAFHALFYEQDTSVALHESRQFVEHCFERAPLAPSHYLNADRDSHSARRYAAMQAWFGLQRVMLGAMGG
eukprot:gene9196-12291_t